ncbi:MAG TPA: helix-turn-helix transcriptional regulator [Ktedonobacteraceae bacterium]|nr:helix-turn-helix transcriptional regulator [Ktedonobacteraceae bacterium]
MYELIILSLLMRYPMHGYLIAKIINDIIGPYAKVSNGRLYPLLSKLEQEGLIATYIDATQTRKGERTQRQYQITEEGRKRFHDLMMDTTSNPGDYQKLFLQKVAVLEFLKSGERLYLIDHYINYCQAHVLHLVAEAEDYEKKGREYSVSTYQYEATLEVMRHRADQWLHEAQWARELREKEMLRIEASEHTTSEAL